MRGRGRGGGGGGVLASCFSSSVFFFRVWDALQLFCSHRDGGPTPAIPTNICPPHPSHPASVFLDLLCVPPARSPVSCLVDSGAGRHYLRRAPQEAAHLPALVPPRDGAAVLLALVLRADHVRAVLHHHELHRAWYVSVEQRFKSPIYRPSSVHYI